MVDFPRYQNLIWSIINKHQHQAPLDDLESEAQEAYLHAKQTYQPGRASFETWLYRIVSQRIGMLLGKMSKEATDELPLNYSVQSPYHEAEYRIDRDKFTEEAKEVISILLNSAGEIMGDKPKIIRGNLIRYLRGQGWQWKTIKLAFQEIQNYFG